MAYLDENGLEYFWGKIKDRVSSAVAPKANDADVVHKTGDETVAGGKTFASPIVADVKTDASARLLSERLADVVNVKDYGAKGDGTTDDTSAIYAAVSAAASGKIVFFPAGTYMIAGSLGISITEDNVKLYGDHAVVKVGKTSTKYSSWLFNITANNFSVIGIEFDGGREEARKDQKEGKQGLIKYTTHAINGTPINGLHVDRCHVHDFWGKTINTYANDTLVENSKFEKCSQWVHDMSSMAGVVGNRPANLSDAAPMKNMKVKNCIFSWCGITCCGFVRTDSVVIEGNYIEWSSEIGCFASYSTNISILNNTIRYTYNDGIDVQQSRGGVVSGNKLFCCGYLATYDSDNDKYELCQALYVGDDYPSDNDSSENITITNNIIQGVWDTNALVDEIPDDLGYDPSYFSGTGICVVRTNGVDISGNIISGMGKPCMTSLYGNSREDGTGIRLTGKMRNVNIHNNTIKNCKRSGVCVAIANIATMNIVDNTIDVTGLHSIECGLDSSAKSISISGNIISGVYDFFGRTANGGISAGIFLGCNSAWFSGLNVMNNIILAATLDEFVKYTHGIYIGRIDGYSTGFVGLGMYSINGNSSADHTSAMIEIFSDIAFSPSSNGYNAIFNNRDAGGLIDNVAGRNAAMTSAQASVPASGAHIAGDIVFKLAPTDEVYGWICIASGTPGTWRELTSDAMS